MIVMIKLTIVSIYGSGNESFPKTQISNRDIREINDWYIMMNVENENNDNTRAATWLTPQHTKEVCNHVCMDSNLLVYKNKIFFNVVIFSSYLNIYHCIGSYDQDIKPSFMYELGT